MSEKQNDDLLERIEKLERDYSLLKKQISGMKEADIRESVFKPIISRPPIRKNISNFTKGKIPPSILKQLKKSLEDNSQ